MSFDDLDEDTNLQKVINQVNLPETCTVQKYTNADKDVPVCIDMEDNSWEENFMLQLQEPTEDSSKENAKEGEDQVITQSEHIVKIFKEAIASLTDVQHFLERKKAI